MKFIVDIVGYSPEAIGSPVMIYWLVLIVEIKSSN